MFFIALMLSTALARNVHPQLDIIQPHKPELPLLLEARDLRPLGLIPKAKSIAYGRRIKRGSSTMCK